jgi:hypothetical protein
MQTRHSRQSGTSAPTRLAAAAVTAAALVLALPGAASAATLVATDPQETHHGSDLRSVRVRNADRAVVVVTRHTDLRPDFRSGASGAVYIDTDRSDPGPEYVFVGGYFEGTDYALLRTDGFAPRTWGRRITAPHRMRLDYDRETVRMRMSRRALGHPGRVRVAVRVVGRRGNGTRVVDWLHEPRSFTRWVARG